MHTQPQLRQQQCLAVELLVFDIVSFPRWERNPCKPNARATWKRVPGRQADGLFQERELWVVEAEGLIHHVGLEFHVHAEDGNGLATATCCEGDLAINQRRGLREEEATEQMQ